MPLEALERTCKRGDPSNLGLHKYYIWLPISPHTIYGLDFPDESDGFLMPCRSQGIPESRLAAKVVRSTSLVLNFSAVVVLALRISSL